MAGGSLIRRTPGYGITVRQLRLPGAIQGIRTDIIGIVGNFPWGPVNTVTDARNAADPLSIFGPPEFGTSNLLNYPSLNAFVRKAIVPAKIVRIDPTSVAAATSTSGTITAGTGTITLNAKYQGLLGDLIARQFVAASNGSATARDLIVQVNGSTVERFRNIEVADLAGAITSSNSRFLAPIVLASPSAMPAVDGSPVLLTGGADGTAVASDFVGSVSSNVGIRRFYADSIQLAALFVANPDNAFKTTINTGLLAWAQDVQRGYAILATPDGATVSATITDAASYRNLRVAYPYPRVTVTNGFDPSQTTEEDGSSHYAAAIAGVLPHQSPGGAPGQPFLEGIKGLELDLSQADLDSLNSAGVSPFVLLAAFNGNSIIRNGISTSLTSGETQIDAIKYGDFLAFSLANFLERYIETALDVDLDAQRLGPNTGTVIKVMETFLAQQRDDVPGSIKAFSVDPFSGNTEPALDTGLWVIEVLVETFGSILNIELRQTVGTTVVVSVQPGQPT